MDTIGLNTQLRYQLAKARLNLLKVLATKSDKYKVPGTKKATGSKLSYYVKVEPYHTQNEMLKLFHPNSNVVNKIKQIGRSRAKQYNLTNKELKYRINNTLAFTKKIQNEIPNVRKKPAFANIMKREYTLKK